MNKYLQESYENAIRENALLQAKLEIAENAFINIRDAAMNNVEDAEYVHISDEALKAIRGN